MVHKGVIVAAGYGTRFLPVTRVVPKELLPIGATPALALVVDELVEAGVTDLLVITSRRKRALEDWFDRDPELEAALAAKPDRLAKAHPPKVRTTFVRQARMGGTGDALRLARDFAGDDPLLVAFPDDLFGSPNPSSALVAAHGATGASVLGALDLSGQDLSAYGVLDAHRDGDVWRVDGVVEKPDAATQARLGSGLVSVGRYLYTPDFFQALEASWDARPADAVGEFWPMEAMEAVAARGQLVAAPLTATRWDTGTPAGWLRCVLDHAASDPDLAPALADFLASRDG